MLACHQSLARLNAVIWEPMYVSSNTVLTMQDAALCSVGIAAALRAMQPQGGSLALFHIHMHMVT
jgi:hypothetical protein